MQIMFTIACLINQWILVDLYNTYYQAFETFLERVPVETRVWANE